MNSLNSFRDLSAMEVSPLNEDIFSHQLLKEVITEIGKPTLECLRQGGLTSSQMNAFYDRMKNMALEGEKIFGKTCDLSDVKIQKFIKTQFMSLIESTAAIMAGQPPDLIREADLSEAVFSHKGDYHPILSTDSLATCIGVAGYDPMNKFGFVVHFTNVDELENSGSQLTVKIRSYREENIHSPLLVHLRGGVKGLSEPLLARVKHWLFSSDVSAIIASEDTLQSPMFPGCGIPNLPSSIKLDVRTGTCETYDPTFNPYSKKKKKPMDELDSNFLLDCFIQALIKKSNIQIVYDSKA